MSQIPLLLSDYATLSAKELSERIEAVRQQLGRKLLILGHHYQSDAVIVHTDIQGDSFQLSREASERVDCESIVFGGVHFMAETADILANRPERIASRGGRRIPVCLPDLEAGCPMADLANEVEITDCWTQLGSYVDLTEVTPITYVNSTAALKAFCGARGGLACTSTNARAVLEWAFAQRPRVLFVPDQHLGCNTLVQMGVRREEMILWNPKLPLGGNTPEAIQQAKAILWYGYCEVHQEIGVQDLERSRQETPGVKIGVHPECCEAVVTSADVAGSTAKLIQIVKNAAPGERWAIGTERILVERLVRLYPDRVVGCVGGSASVGRYQCKTMAKTTLTNLAWTVENIARGTPVNVITVPEAVATDARLALERMLAAK